MLNTLHRYQSSRPFSPIFSYIWNLMLDQILTQIISLLTTPEMADYDPAIFQELEPESFNTTLLEDKSVSRACERACERASVRACAQSDGAEFCALVWLASFGPL